MVEKPEIVEEKNSTKFWIGRTSKLQPTQYEPYELSCGVQCMTEGLTDPKALAMYRNRMEALINETLDRQEYQEIMRRGLSMPQRLKYLDVEESKPAKVPEKKTEQTKADTFQTGDQIAKAGAQPSKPATIEQMKELKLLVESKHLAKIPFEQWKKLTIGEADMLIKYGQQSQAAHDGTGDTVHDGA